MGYYGKKRAKKRILKNKSLNCFYCGCEMVFQTEVANGRAKATRDKLPANFCTIEHVFPRRHPLRYKMKNILILACSSCNKRKGALDYFKTPEELLEDSLATIGKLYEPEFRYYREENAHFFKAATRKPKISQQSENK